VILGERGGFAQNATGPRTASGLRVKSKGIELGVSRATFGDIDIEPEFRWEPRTGLAVAAFCVLGTDSIASIEIDGVYAQRGARVVNRETGQKLEVWDLEYIDVAILGRADALRSRSVSGFAIGGLALGYRVSATENGRDAKWGIDALQLGLVIGVGVDVWLSTAVGVTADLRYTHGTSDIGSIFVGGNHRVTSLMAGVVF
jgi:hypothetical protein